MNRGCDDFQRTCRLSRRSLLKVGSGEYRRQNLPALLAHQESKNITARQHVIFLHQFNEPFTSRHVRHETGGPGWTSEAPSGRSRAISPVCRSPSTSRASPRSWARSPRFVPSITG